MKLTGRTRKKQRAQRRLAEASLVRKCLRALELPQDALPGEPRVVLSGCGSALVENVSGVSELTPQCVRLRLPGGEVALFGSGLALRDARPGAVYVTGRISRLELPGGRA